MTKILIGFALGVTVSTIGFTGFIKLFNSPEVKHAAKVADTGVVNAQKMLREEIKK